MQENADQKNSEYGHFLRNDIFIKNFSAWQETSRDQKQPEACNFIKKETLAQVFSCKFYEISLDTLFIEHLWTTASVRSRPKTKRCLRFKGFEVLKVQK